MLKTMSSSKLSQLLKNLHESVTLTQDDIGIEVAILQRLLVFYGYLSSQDVNGVFDYVIDNAVRQFQHDNGLYEDGIVGHYTWMTLADYENVLSLVV